MTQYLIEEACAVALDAYEAARLADQAREDSTVAAEQRTAEKLAELRSRDR